MNIKKNISLNLGFLGLFILSGYTTCRAQDQIIVTSIPKCGTHMLLKCISLLTGRQIKSNMVKNRKERDHLGLGAISPAALRGWNSKNIMFTHIPYNEEYLPYLADNTKTFFIVRDPRDQIVSMAHWVYKKDGAWPNLEKLNMNELITALIVDGEEIYGKPFGIKGFYEAWLPWMKVEDVCMTSFEKLVGPGGGGSAQAQLHEVRKIIKHLGLHLTETEITKSTDKIFGKKMTYGVFRKGKIGGWKEHFTNEHKKLMKEHAGHLLIDLGYEKDLNW